MIKTVPFFSNTPDDTHCFQAAFRMVLKYFLPERNFTWQQLEKMSAKVEGLSTWPQAMLLELHKMDFDIRMIEGFDAQAFTQEGGDYLLRAFGEEAGNWQITNSNIPQEQRLYQKLLVSNVLIENRIPSLDECKPLLDEGYLIICTVNSCRLNNQSGYIGHAVVVYDIDDQYITLHDPGLPPKKARRVELKAFRAAWADPNDQATNLIAIRYKPG